MVDEGPTPGRPARRPATQREGLAAARRIWAGPFLPHLLKQVLLAGIVSLGWLRFSWIAFLISFVVILTVALLVRASFIRRYGKDDDAPAALE